MADRDGLHTLTLRRLATELDVHVTSLYNHVDSKETVVDGIVDLLVQEADLPREPMPWEQWVRNFAESMRSVALAHPGAFAAFGERPVQSPQALESSERALEAFRAAGFDVVDAYSALKAAMLSVLGGLLEEVVRESDGPTTDLTEVALERFPHTRDAHLVADTADTWTFLVETLVRGIAAMLAERA